MSALSDLLREAENTHIRDWPATDALLLEAAAALDAKDALIYAYPPSEPFAQDGQTWKQVAELQKAERAEP
jgi:hypothetical protein